jgi:hypothetical protein
MLQTETIVRLTDQRQKPYSGVHGFKWLVFLRPPWRASGLANVGRCPVDPL